MLGCRLSLLSSLPGATKLAAPTLALPPRVYRIVVETPAWVLKKSLRSAGKISKSMLKGNVPSHAALDFDPRRPADHDGTPRPLRSVVLLLPSGRSGS